MCTGLPEEKNGHVFEYWLEETPKQRGEEKWPDQIPRYL